MVKESFDKNGLLSNVVIVEVTIFLRVYQQGIQKYKAQGKRADHIPNTK